MNDNEENDVNKQDLEEGSLNETPGFYKSVSGQAVAEIFKNRQTVYKDLLRFRNVIQDIQVTVPAAQLIGFNTIPGFATVNLEHGVRKNVPFVFFNVQIVAESMVVPAPTVNETNFTSTLINYAFGDRTVNLEAFVYEILEKN